MQPEDIIVLADALVDKDVLSIAAGSILVTALLILIAVLREKSTKLRLVFGLVALALAGWGFWLFTSPREYEKQARAAAASQEAIGECRQTLEHLRGLAEGKLAAVHDRHQAKAIADVMLRAIDRSKCARPREDAGAP